MFDEEFALLTSLPQKACGCFRHHSYQHSGAREVADYGLVSGPELSTDFGAGNLYERLRNIAH